MSTRKLVVHIIVLLYLVISVLHQVYYDQAYKVLGIKGSIEFARAWPIVGLFLILAIWLLWAIASWRLRKSHQKPLTRGSGALGHDRGSSSPRGKPAPEASSYTTEALGSARRD